MLGDTLTDGIAALWRRQFGSAEGLDILPCAAGGNNRVFKARQGGRTAAAKFYFAASHETRDRLDAEWRFLAYAAEAGIDAMPRPLARDDEARLALHGFCDGGRMAAGDIGERAVTAAADLFRALNQDPGLAAAAELPAAAEACFSPAAQIALVEGRLARLGTIAPVDPLSAQAAALAGRMTAFGAELGRRIRRELTAIGIDPDADIGLAERCLSPSDFGFHNALKADDGTIRFIDFEYAGWDDPVKMVCDFFLQPALPPPPGLAPLFFERALGARPDAERLFFRAGAMRPLFALKWCCIMLNPFLPATAARSRFADPERDETDLKTARLEAAAAAFTSLQG